MNTNLSILHTKIASLSRVLDEARYLLRNASEDERLGFCAFFIDNAEEILNSIDNEYESNAITVRA